MKKIKRILALSLSLVTLIALFASCNAGQKSDAINVISREEGSGTRGAFTELMDIIENEVDMTAETAEIAKSTAVVITTVEGDASAIGYISLGALSDKVKAIEIDGVAPSAENVKNGTYKVARPFNLGYKADSLSPAAEDFIKYILSSEGQAVVEKEGYISAAENAESYKAANISGKIVLSGSTSIGPVMEVLADEYKKLNPNAVIEVQQSGSSAGVSDAISGVCDIAMVSREIKQSELDKGLEHKVMAMDGIAVIVNKSNEAAALTAEQVKDIFTGKISAWSEIA